MTFRTAGEKRKFYRNMRENVSARQLGVVGLNLGLLLGPIGLVLVAAFALFATNHAHAGVLAAASAPMVRFNIKALREKDAELKEEGEKILASAKGRMFTADERTRLDAINAGRKSVGEEVGRVEAEMDKIRTKLAGGDVSTKPTGRKYGELFGAAQDNGGWETHSQFVRAVGLGMFDQRLTATASSGSGPDGGFAVPSTLVQEILDQSLEGEIVRPMCDVVPMETSELNVWDFDASNSSSVLYGAFSGQWVSEGGEFTEETPKLRLIHLVANKLGLLSQIPNELLNDAPGYDGRLQAVMAKAAGWFLDRGFFVGTGAGSPLGALNAPSTITVSKEVGQAADTIVIENLNKMFARLHPACIGNSVWVCNSTAIPQLLGLTRTVKNVAGTENVGGSYVPVISESNGQFTILTRPVKFTEKLNPLGDRGDIIFADWSQYKVGMRREMTLDRSAHVGFTRDTTYFRGILRADGQPKWAAAYTPKNGDTLSWCVTLEAR